MKSNKSISRNCILGSFKLFPSSKIDFWPFLKCQKMEFGQKKISSNWFIWFHKSFGLDFFKFSDLLCKASRRFRPILDQFFSTGANFWAAGPRPPPDPSPNLYIIYTQNISYIFHDFSSFGFVALVHSIIVYIWNIFCTPP